MNRLSARWSSGFLGKLLILVAGFVFLSVVFGVCGLMLNVFSPVTNGSQEEDLPGPVGDRQESSPTADPSPTPRPLPSPAGPELEETPALEPESDMGEIKFGYSEAERKEIFLELVRAEDRATNEAEFRFPTPDPLGEIYSEDAALVALDGFLNYFNEYAPQYRTQVAERFSLSMDQLDEIGAEGALNEWPFPDLPTPIPN